MGNLVLTCVPVVPLEQRVGDGPGGFEKMGEGSGGEKVANVRPTTFMSEVEGIHEPPTTLAKVLSNAVYAMAFHKHLALTNRSENYEFFQAVSHFAHETTANCQLTEAARKIYQLYVSETAPLRVDLDDGICRSIEKAIDGGKVTKDMFDPATMEVVSTMEKESLSEFLVSSTYLELRKRKEEGGLDQLLKEDLESIKDIMSKEARFVEFLGDPGLSVVLSSKIGIDKFRQYLVIEFAEEGIDLLLATRSLLVKAKATKTTPASTATTTKKTTTTTTTATTPKEKGEGDVGDGIAEGEEDGGEKDVGGDGGAGGDGDGSQASTESGIVAPAAETPQEEGGGGGGGGRGGGGREGEEGALEGKKGEARDMPATTEENPAPAPAPAQEKQPDRGGGGEGVCDIQLEGKNIYERFIKSGCGAECNLPGTVVKKVSNVLANEGTTMEEIVQAFQVVEAEIFKLLAYDPFPRFKRRETENRCVVPQPSGMYTKYCMKARLHTQRSSLTHISEKSSCGNNSQSEISSRRFNMRE
ncbi:unnamed protein product [Ectocarpus sp. 12 AP-2014]